MIYIVQKNNILFRAFSSYDDAVTYCDRKRQIMHEHCCVCEDCPNINYYAEHDHYNYGYYWSILNVPLDTLNDVDEMLFLVSRNREIEKVFVTYQEAKTYIKEIKDDDSWEIKFCDFSNECLEISQYKEDGWHYIKNGKIDNQL